MYYTGQNIELYLLKQMNFSGCAKTRNESTRETIQRFGCHKRRFRASELSKLQCKGIVSTFLQVLYQRHQRCIEISTKHCHGKVLSLMEGGYSDKAICSGVFCTFDRFTKTKIGLKNGGLNKSLKRLFVVANRLGNPIRQKEQKMS